MKTSPGFSKKFRGLPFLTGEGLPGEAPGKKEKHWKKFFNGDQKFLVNVNEEFYQKIHFLGKFVSKHADFEVLT